jgi:hypothetical protein
MYIALQRYGPAGVEQKFSRDAACTATWYDCDAIRDDSDLLKEGI